MTIAVHPDPHEPAGGFALLELPGGALPGNETIVAVQDAFAERWLGPGQPGGGDPWRAERFEFGPYAVHRRDQSDWVRIGPEIVDNMSEYASLRISVGPVTDNLVWPDDIPARPRAAASGEIRAVAAPRRPVPPRKPELPPRAESGPESGPPEAMEAEAEAPLRAARGDRRIGLLALLLAALLLGLVVVWFLAGPDDAPPEQDAAPAPDAAGVAETIPGGGGEEPRQDRCTRAALASVEGGFAAVKSAIADCGGSVPPDTVLGLVEDAAAAGDGAALLLFGMLYDGTVVDEDIERGIGLSLGDDPAKAAEYYSRAELSGEPGAAAPLAGACARIARSGATLDKGAFDDFCR